MDAKGREWFLPIRVHQCSFVVPLLLFWGIREWTRRAAKGSYPFAFIGVHSWFRCCILGGIREWTRRAANDSSPFASISVHSWIRSWVIGSWPAKGRSESVAAGGLDTILFHSSLAVPKFSSSPTECPVAFR